VSIQVEARINRSPYGDVLPDPWFENLVWDLLFNVAELIESSYQDGSISRDSFGLCILDPTAPLWEPSRDCVLVTAAIGEEGRWFVHNAMAKAISTRDAGTEWGQLLYSQPHRIPSDSFRWGFAANVDGTIVGGSGLKEQDDKGVCQVAGTVFNNMIAESFAEWEERHPRMREGGTSHSWFNNSGTAPGWLHDHQMYGFDGDFVTRFST
jgi:hypothetical protein